jgi:hypothetical protein
MSAATTFCRDHRAISAATTSAAKSTARRPPQGPPGDVRREPDAVMSDG